MEKAEMQKTNTDLHTHILPKMDDGSADLQMTLSMLDSLEGQGVTRICATSHYYVEKESVEAFAERRKAAIEQIIGAGKASACRIIPGAEVTYYRGISEAGQLDLLCMQGTKSLLLEMPFMEWNRYQVEEVISLVLDRGYHVILAHPERFLFSSHNEHYIEKLTELPISLQVNADTLLHLRTRRKGFWLLQMTDSPLLGSDCHNTGKRAPSIERARKMIQSRLGEEFLHTMDACAARVLLHATEVTMR